MFDCEKCKFYDVDFVWDDECDDEEEIEICEKGHELPCENECKDFKRYRQRKQKEKFFECDICGNLSKCITTGNLIETTTIDDTIRHFMKSSSCKCK